jgi:putative transposase
MARYLLTPTPEQAAVMREHCAHARCVWNLAVEQQSWWRRGRKGAPGYLEQCRQLTAARAENGWLRAGSQMVQQQALRDVDRAMRSFFAGMGKLALLTAWLPAQPWYLGMGGPELARGGRVPAG